ncbi:MAG: toll/interleukin-1 receptor domain-containing protein [Candidatus Odinarchaeota archaeon]
MGEEAVVKIDQVEGSLKYARIYIILLAMIMTVFMFILFVFLSFTGSETPFSDFTYYYYQSSGYGGDRYAMLSVLGPLLALSEIFLPIVLSGSIIAYYIVARVENRKTRRTGTSTVTPRYNRSNWIIAWFIIIGLVYGIFGTLALNYLKSLNSSYGSSVSALFSINDFLINFTFNSFYPIIALVENLFFTTYGLQGKLLNTAVFILPHVISFILIYRFRDRAASIPSKIANWSYIAFRLVSWPVEVLLNRANVISSRMGDKISEVSQGSSTRARKTDQQLLPDTGETDGLKIFFSYATKDSERYRITELARLLESKADIGRVYFWEQHATGSIIEYMDKRVEDSDTCVFFYSKHATKSKPVQMERDMAVYQNKHIVPVFTDINDVPSILKIQAGVDAKNRSPEQVVDELYRLIIENHAK